MTASRRPRLVLFLSEPGRALADDGALLASPFLLGACVEPAGPRRESVDVPTSHLGMGHHPAVLWVVADRLAQPEGTWAPFRPPAIAGRLLQSAEAAGTMA